MNKSSKQGKSKTSQTSTVKTVTTNVNKPRTQQQQKQQQKQKPKGMSKSEVLSSYTKTLNNPFDYPGVPLGFGTMVATKCATSAYRGNFTSNATDGSFTVFTYPSADLMGVVQTLGAAIVPAYANYGLFSDGAVSAALANFGSARPISHAVRITALSSNNDKPSQIVSGLVPYSSAGVASTATNDIRTQLMLTTSSALFSSHELKEHVLESGGGHCIQVNWRPLDISSFQFTRDLLQFNSASSSRVLPAQGPVCVITGVGPVSMNYAVDIVTRWEGIPNFAGMFSGDSSTKHSKLSDYFPSVESLWSNIQDHLNLETFKTASDTINIVYDAWQQTSSTPKFLLAIKSSEPEHKEEEKAELISPVSKSPPKSGILSYIS